MNSPTKADLVKRALSALFHDIDYLEKATGLFASEKENANRLVDIARRKRDEEANASGQRPSAFASRLRDISRNYEREYDPEMIAHIQQERLRLESLEVPEIEARIEEIYQYKKDLEEARQPFNQEENRLQSQFLWVRRSVWSPQEAVLILSGREPSAMLIEYLDKMSSYAREKSEFANAYFLTLEVMQTAIDVGEISTPGRPLEYIQWYDKTKTEFDEELRLNVLEIHDPKAFKALKGDQVSSSREKYDLLNSERNSLLTLIAAMAIEGYKYDPKAKRNEATSDIQSDAELLGLPLDQKTILKWLREACKLLPSEKR